MANIAYVDWDGLVYYDTKIKAYISNINKELLHVGGVVSAEQLPDPHRETVNFIYQLSEDVSTTLDRFTSVETLEQGSWVICVEVSPNVFKYAILSKNITIDISQYYTIYETDKLLEEHKRQFEYKLENEYVSKKELFEEDLIFVCGNADTQETDDLVDYIESNKLSIVVGLGSDYKLTDWVEYDSLDDIPLEANAYYSVGNTVGYQAHFIGNAELIPQMFAIPSGCEIIYVYKFDAGGTNEWLPQDVIPSFEWKQGDTINININGVMYSYDTYEYDVGNMGDALTTNESWRFEFGG